MRQNGFHAHAGVSAVNAVDVQRGGEQHLGIGVPARHAVDPAFHRQRFLHGSFASGPVGGAAIEDPDFFLRRRADRIVVAGDEDGIAVDRNQARNRLGEAQGGGIHQGLQRSVNLRFRRPAPGTAAGFDLEVDDALHAQRQPDRARAVLAVARKHHAFGGLQPRSIALDQFGIVGRAQLFFALRQHHQIHRQGTLGGDDRCERVQKGTLRALLIGRAARHQHRTEVGFDQRARERIDLPVWLHGLHVVHHVHGQRLSRPRVVIAPHSGVSRGRDHLSLGETQRFEVAAQ